MRPAEVADEQVIAAGKALQEAGQSVTGYALRRKVGGVGSAARLAAIWAKHQATQQAQPAPLADLPVEVAEQLGAITKELGDRLATLTHGLYDKAVRAAERRVTDLIRTVEETRGQAEREIADADQAVSELETSLEQTREALADLETRHQQAVADGQAKDIELATQRERLAADHQEIERLRAEAQQVTQAREESAGLRGEIRSLKQQNEQLLQALGNKG